MTRATTPAHPALGARPGRHTADERRVEIVEAAIVAFAAGGLHGTSTEPIAKAAGITQPYLFRLFGTKKDLFIAAVRASFERTRLAFEEAGKAVGGPGAGPEAALVAMGGAYWRLLRDRTLLLMQLQAYAACDDREVRTAVRDGFGTIVDTVRAQSGAPDDVLRVWFAQGMLWNTAVAMDLSGEDAPWASMCLMGESMDRS
jgi:AcrR family transcriptional regulator